jgi:hypothetical protein
MEVYNMKITGFNPMIVSNKAEDIIQLFEEMGFSKQHDVSGQTESDYRAVVMKDADQNKVDIAQIETERDSMLLRMNVDDFQEAYEFLIQKGFVNTRGDGTVGTATSKAATMVSPSGFVISLIQHIK